jgi:hypothetical protein
MTIKYIREYYGVPVKRGTEVRLKGKQHFAGVVTGTTGPYLRVRVDEKHTYVFYPLELEYLQDGEWVSVKEPAVAEAEPQKDGQA